MLRILNILFPLILIFQCKPALATCTANGCVPVQADILLQKTNEATPTYQPGFNKTWYDSYGYGFLDENVPGGPIYALRGRYKVPYDIGPPDNVLVSDGNDMYWRPDYMGDIAGPATSTMGNVPAFGGEDGKTLVDSGVPADEIVTTPDDFGGQYRVVLTDAAKAVTSTDYSFPTSIASCPPFTVMFSDGVGGFACGQIPGKKTGNIPLDNATYSTATPITGALFDYDSSTAVVITLEVKRSDVGDERTMLVKYHLNWLNGQWKVSFIEGDFQTDPTGVIIGWTQNIPTKQIQFTFTAPVALPGTYDPINSYISFFADEITRFQ